MKIRDNEEYTYLEWITGIMMSVEQFCQSEIMRYSHDDEEKPEELIENIEMAIRKFKSQIPE